jgi:hypothetical protein
MILTPIVERILIVKIMEKRKVLKEKAVSECPWKGHEARIMLVILE